MAWRWEANIYDVAIPLCSAGLFDGKTSRLDTRDWWWLSIVGRLKPDVTAEQLQVETQDWQQTAAIIDRFFAARAEDFS